MDAMAGVHAERLVVVVGGVRDADELAATLLPAFGDGPVVVGPLDSTAPLKVGPGGLATVRAEGAVDPPTVVPDDASAEPGFAITLPLQLDLSVEFAREHRFHADVVARLRGGADRSGHGDSRRAGRLGDGGGHGNAGLATIGAEDEAGQTAEALAAGGFLALGRDQSLGREARAVATDLQRALLAKHLEARFLSA